MTLPAITQLYDVIEHTWPAAKVWDQGPFTLRQGNSGGSRVSASTLNAPAATADLTATENAMQDMGQPRLFMVQHGQEAFDADLDAGVYVVKDPCWIYAAPIEAMTQDALPHKTCFPVWPPLAAQSEFWELGGIGPARLAIMERAREPKTAVLGRANDRPAGTVFAAIHSGIAMLHALEIHPDFRRLGVGRHLTKGVAHWAKSQGASHLSLITTQANTAANALYTSLGMQVVGQYHYRIKN